MSQPGQAERNSAAGYELAGELIRAVYGDHIHYGYWQNPVDDIPLALAQERLTDLVLDKLGAGPHQRVLDVGCGTGGLARRARVTTGADITGITVSEWEVGAATRMAAAAGLADGVRFQRADVTDLPFHDRSFDGAVVVEVLIHVPDKRGAFRQLRRVLRPGARLVLAEPVKRKPLDSEQVATWLGNRMAPVPTRDRYVELFAAAGFRVEEASDLTEAIRPSFASLTHAVATRTAELADRYSPEMLRLAAQVILDVQAVAADCHGYTLFVLT